MEKTKQKKYSVGFMALGLGGGAISMVQNQNEKDDENLQ